jgi:hypothetical protein
MKPGPLITAQLIGSDTATALGITATSSTPVLELCRRLLVAGHAASTPLHAYRGETLSLRVRSIGEGARLRVRGDGRGFEAEECRPAAPPMRETGSGGSRHPPDRKRANDGGPQ